jgi:hypothetical protein
LARNYAPVAAKGCSVNIAEFRAMAASALLLIAAFILFVLSAIGVGGRINLQSAGLACLTLAMLLGASIL